ncbi:MAG: large-conductance mechanosensitive channel protein MscL [Phycisphaerae bacterium]|nr:large-conductance mechanosensitive channel protein MscL [Phycisphaerae bacterium]
MGMLKEFREFAFKGNMIDMAVGIIIGAAFGGLVKSLVDKVLMPPLGLLIGGLDFTEFKLRLRDAVIENGDVVKPAVELGYGEFISVFINFLIVAFAVFLLVKGINTARKRFEAEAPAPAPAGPTQEQLLAEIRDLLKIR